jgi:hypothetical protein
MQVSADLRAQSINHHGSMDIGHLNSRYASQDAADRINHGSSAPSYTTPTCYAGSSHSPDSSYSSQSSYGTVKSNGTRCYVCCDRGCVSCGGGSSSWSNKRVNM